MAALIRSSFPAGNLRLTSSCPAACLPAINMVDLFRANHD
jgi:hypothetical protein